MNRPFSWDVVLVPTSMNDSGLTSVMATEYIVSGDLLRGNSCESVAFNLGQPR